MRPRILLQRPHVVVRKDGKEAGDLTLSSGRFTVWSPVRVPPEPITEQISGSFAALLLA